MKKLFFTLTALVLTGTALFAQTFKLETFTDAKDGGTSTMAVKETTETIDGKPCTVWVFSGNPTKAVKYPYVGCRIYPDEAALAQYRNAKGVSFMCSLGTGGSGSYRLAAVTPGGGGNDYKSSFKVNKKAGAVKLEYGKMAQDKDGGEKKSFDRSAIQYLEVQFATMNLAAKPVEFKIWDLKPLN
jgi:hypothetical protein